MVYLLTAVVMVNSRAANKLFILYSECENRDTIFNGNSIIQISQAFVNYLK